MKNQMLDETALKCIQLENLVGWTRKSWTDSLIKNKLYPTSINPNFVFYFLFYKFARSQMHSTFRPTLKIYDAGWNVECICFGLKVFAVFLRYALLQYSVPITLKLLLEKLLLVSDQSLLHVWLNHNDLATLMIFCTVI